MQHEEMILEEYKIYSQMKERFIDRNFATNKFYLLVILGILLIILFTKDFSFAYGFSSTLIFTAIGMLVCVMWWINVDSYNFLIRIKLREVLEEIEKQLPISPNKMEIEAITSLKKGKREFLFADIQKLIATVLFILLLLLFGYEILLMIFA